jgi:predicted SnoaL-like aldol condensation-catalyzing enzyme
VEGFAEQFPQMSLDIKRAVGEGDLVVTHSLLKTSPEDRGTAAVDIFRPEDGKVAEEWDSYDALGLMQQIGAIPEPGEQAGN